MAFRNKRKLIFRLSVNRNYRLFVKSLMLQRPFFNFLWSYFSAYLGLLYSTSGLPWLLAEHVIKRLQKQIRYHSRFYCIHSDRGYIFVWGNYTIFILFLKLYVRSQLMYCRLTRCSANWMRANDVIHVWRQPRSTQLFCCYNVSSICVTGLLLLHRLFNTIDVIMSRTCLYCIGLDWKQFKHLLIPSINS